MNHDICHCKGVDCNLKMLCRRYLAHVDAERNNISKQLMYIEPTYVGNKCESFFRHYESI